MVASTTTTTISPSSCSTAGTANFEAIAIVHRLLLLLLLAMSLLLLSSHRRTAIGVVFQSRNGVGRRWRFIPIMTG